LHAHRLDLDADAARGGKAPREQHEHRADAASQVGDQRQRRVSDHVGGEPGGDEVVERPAVTTEQLEDAPVAGEVAEVLAGHGPEVRASRRRRGRGPVRAPAGRPAGGPHYAGYVYGAHRQ
jgi:hypothetical protein